MSIQKKGANSLFKNVLAGFSVSFLILSLGAVFGVISERGAFVGMFSAVVMSLVTAFLSGTKVQATSPTGPMTATLIAVALQSEKIDLAGVSSLQFVNFSVLLAGVLLLLAGVFKLDKFIKYVPNIVISGFMTGIGLLIFFKELKFLFGWSGTQQITGDLSINLVIAGVVLILSFVISAFLAKKKTGFWHFVPPTLLVIFVGALIVYILGMHSKIELVSLGVDDVNLSVIWSFFTDQLPNIYSWKLLWMALPVALEIALIAYLDTLMTALVVESKMGEKANHQKDLYSQGIATSLVATFGGIPGAQSTVPSVMLLNEGAKTRIATISMGVFALLGLFLLTDLISLIPQAVFVGVILKISYDVADMKPFYEYFNKAAHISTNQILFVLVVALLTAFVGLNFAVIGSTAVYLLYKRFFKKNLVRDFILGEESEGYLDEI